MGAATMLCFVRGITGIVEGSINIDSKVFKLINLKEYMAKEGSKKSVQKKQKNNKNSDNTLGLLSHLLALFTGFLGPLIILLASDEEAGKKHSKLALNWQFSFLIYSIAGVILSTIIIGFLVLGAAGILNIIFCIIATVKASEGKYWNYPLSIPFFKVKK